MTFRTSDQQRLGDQQIILDNQRPCYLAQPILVFQGSKIFGLGGVRVKILFENELPGSDLPYSKGFMKFRCPEPSKKRLTFETSVRQRGV